MEVGHDRADERDCGAGGGFGEDLFTGGLAQREDEFLVLQRREKGHIVLVIDDHDGQGRT